MKRDTDIEKTNIFLVFIILPIFFVLIGIFLFPYPLDQNLTSFASIVVFIGLLILGFGAILKNNELASIIKMLGWLVVSFFWVTQINSLYFGEDGDLTNAVICIVGIFFLFYFAYHEWLSYIRKEKINFLYWVSGAASIAGLIYFGFELTPLEMWLREVVANQSGGVLSIITDGVRVVGDPMIHIMYKKAHVVLIFACTGVQSMVIFVGMILPLKTVDMKRKILGLFVTVVPVYVLNLFRNALVVFLVGEGITDFNMAHNVIAKAGSLIALIALLLILIKIIPEVFDEIFELFNLHKRDGPLEKYFKKIWSSK